MDEVTLAKAFIIVVEECGASPALLPQFLANTQFQPDWTEWRFQGKLGFGGKLWKTHSGRLYVGYYAEDETEERFQMAKRANQRLAKLTDEPTKR